MSQTILRMRCIGKRHRRLLPIPAGYQAGWDGRIHENQGRLIGGRWVQLLLECASPGPCWDNPVQANLRSHMKTVAVKGHLSETRCGARCTGATGPDCECECAGANHGLSA
jgi:hypothetical protein